MPPDDQNPYDDPTLHEGWRRGWQAWVEGKPRRAQLVSEESEMADAWMDGYEAAEEQEAS